MDAALHGARVSWQAEKAHGEEIAWQLGALGTVEVARFFSGAALRIDGVMFGFMSRGSLFLRVDDVSRPAFVAAGMGPFSYSGRTRTVNLEGSRNPGRRARGCGRAVRLVPWRVSGRVAGGAAEAQDEARGGGVARAVVFLRSA